MRRTELLQEVRQMRFEEAYGGWKRGKLTQEEAARILGVCDRTFRRYTQRFDDGGMEALLDKRITQASHRLAPVDEVVALADRYRKRGIFCSLYTDRGSHYWYTPEVGGKVDKENSTQFGRAMNQLGIEMIPAYSPEARGRSERMFGTHQDRLTKELALYGITDMEAANRYLEEVYLPAFNEEFSQPPLEEGSAFVPLIGANLNEILCEQHDRTVGGDNCVSFNGKKLQIPADKHRCHYVKANVRVHCYENDSMAVFHGPRRLADYDEDGKPVRDEKATASAQYPLRTGRPRKPNTSKTDFQRPNQKADNLFATKPDKSICS